MHNPAMATARHKPPMTTPTSNHHLQVQLKDQ